MSEKKDMVSSRIGRLTVVAEAGRSSNGATKWLCRCDCGREVIVRGADLRRGSQKSCGCLRADVAAARDNIHGGRYTRLYSIWRGMRARCNNPNHRRFKDYGGRGVHICAEWDSFAAFRDWAVANGYRDDLTLDRKNNDGNYEPGNCQWATYLDQRHNRRR